MTEYPSYPPDMEELPDDHDFFDDLATLIEAYESKEDMDRERLLYATEVFADEWIGTLHVTGETW